ncbi:alpha/beta fold hydrolase [Parendozoicomonas haliclonae]|uniref:2-hydroxy-6-oxononadienedioate/2-hydroxy-6-oxononatrienedioate hydrolase n=1 Tax=Parendozoicomonas haliclonae TaxID=1960125 RepID=A0A1X7AMD5_9GAMM|nr:alpha/beta hydrolase [Parendozoicomonas haliclonae]SMA49369.1 2-hydroxy-6-oxononadienedioate/2-hydroxy-6-oxononatrienedioate hydrolase [Parendozoicomonas haliclonae]
MIIKSHILRFVLPLALFFLAGCATQVPVTELSRYAQPPSQFLSIKGMRVHVRDQGNPDKPALVMLHGIFSSLHTWEKWRPHLEKDFRLISLDLPNFGMTGPFPSGETSDDAYMAVLEEVAEQLQLKEFYLAGNSLGGYFSYQYAARNPEQVKKLVMLDPAGFFFVPPAAMMLWGTPVVGQLVDEIEPPRFVMESLLKNAYHNADKVTDTELNRYADLLSREGNREAGGRMVRHIRNSMGFDLSKLDQLTMPVLIIWGEEDNWIPVRHAQQFHDAIKGSELIIYPEVGHMPMEEIPEQSAQDVAAFLNK